MKVNWCQDVEIAPERSLPNMLIFSLIYVNYYSLLFQNLVWNLRYLSHVAGYYAFYYMPMKYPIQNVWGNLLHQVGLGHFDVPNWTSGIIVLAVAQ